MSARANWQPITTAAEVQNLRAAAAADDHQVIWPTHMAVKAGVITGYASLGAVGLLNLWSHSKRMTARDSLTLWREMEAKAREIGFPALCVPCGNGSPFRPLMPRAGYELAMESGFFIKNLNPKGGH